MPAPRRRAAPPPDRRADWSGAGAPRSCGRTASASVRRASGRVAMSLTLWWAITSGAKDDCYISNMLRLVFGLLKGAVVGGALGWAAFKLGVTAGAAAVITYAIIGGVVGMLCGKPPWRQDTFWTSALKGIGGLIVGGLLYWGGSKLFGGLHIALPAALGASPDR